MVLWNQGFSGSAEVTVQGINECDTGTASPARNIMINPVPSPAVSGITSVCKGQEITYNISSTTGSTFIWSVSGGTITSGQSSSEITVLWGFPGTGTVSVSETSVAGCTGSSLVLSVAISECTGSTENLPEGRIVYPNPATNSVFIQNCRDTQIRIFSMEGKLLLQKEIPDDSIELDISGYSKGMYSIVIQGKSVAVFEKLIIK
jgi:hypothetical protein